MDCHCCSKSLYRSDYTHPQEMFDVDGKHTMRKRIVDQHLISSTHPFPNIENKIKETAELWLPTQIQRISWDQITFNPLWFCQKFLSKNIPCIITDVLQGDDIFERWSDPKYLCDAVQGQKQSMSLTPDGFADSIRGQYFIEPHQQKVELKDFFEYKEAFPGSIPYIQHQNGNLVQQFQSLNCQVSQQIVKHVSEYFFKGRDPDAQNFWLGYDDSVSSLHKDPYQNFYMTIVGQKHFTLMPPHSILHLQQQSYHSAKWHYNKQLPGDNKFECKSTGQSNKWICVNPDLKEDVERFSTLKQIQSYHVTIKKQEMLYLPSLWYHQVSQVRGKDPYILAINYWFDMEYAQNYSLYETCRGLRNLM